MKLYKFLDFCKLPNGVVFQEYAFSALESICIRGNILYNNEGRPFDFCFKDLLPYFSSLNASEKGIDIFWQQREGPYANFRSSSLFLVYEKEDIENLFKRINNQFSSDSKDVFIMTLPWEND